VEGLLEMGERGEASSDALGEAVYHSPEKKLKKEMSPEKGKKEGRFFGAQRFVQEKTKNREKEVIEISWGGEGAAVGPKGPWEREAVLMGVKGGRLERRGFRRGENVISRTVRSGTENEEDDLTQIRKRERQRTGKREEARSLATSGKGEVTQNVKEVSVNAGEKGNKGVRLRGKRGRAPFPSKAESRKEKKKNWAGRERNNALYQGRAGKTREGKDRHRPVLLYRHRSEE